MRYGEAVEDRLEDSVHHAGGPHWMIIYMHWRTGTFDLEEDAGFLKKSGGSSR
jgi:hypothetical protein